ncbi:hypothetical protein [Flavobacterium selenitireducens]|uniref:hypothetical protein n=1 Tax=Flavobacterium selenitireducens TaxID=2722704 RepID=UPI00168B37BC|nr:hypothetical protein [Flavobacterium selenitireducens]MBD3583422.1 hypothetical protein [Flavobacterium selenitireducens]
MTETQDQIDDAFVAEINKNSTLEKRKKSDRKLLRKLLALAAVAAFFLFLYNWLNGKSLPHAIATGTTGAIVFGFLVSVLLASLIALIPGSHFSYKRRFIRCAIIVGFAAESVSLFISLMGILALYFGIN